MDIEKIIGIITSIKDIKELEDKQWVIEIEDLVGSFKNFIDVKFDNGVSLQLLGYKDNICHLLYTRQRYEEAYFSKRNGTGNKT